jgi:hypothetical protein
MNNHSHAGPALRQARKPRCAAREMDSGEVGDEFLVSSGGLALILGDWRSGCSRGSSGCDSGDR